MPSRLEESNQYVADSALLRASIHGNRWSFARSFLVDLVWVMRPNNDECLEMLSKIHELKSFRDFRCLKGVAKIIKKLFGETGCCWFNADHPTASLAQPSTAKIIRKLLSSPRQT